MTAYKDIGHVSDAGGGFVSVYVNRDLDNYPELGTRIFIAQIEFKPPRRGFLSRIRRALAEISE